MKKFRTFINKLIKLAGPGFISGTADDDPSGIATYSIAGSQYGYKLNWLSLFLIPMMISIQEMCGRIGMCSGMGLAGVIKKYYSKKLLYFAVALLITANIINISADLGIMAASIQMITGFNFLLLLLGITTISIVMEIFIPYRIYVNFLKWMGLTLFVYVITALTIKQNWIEILTNTLIPQIEFSPKYFMTLVGFIGTTISPYLFFWQASEEIEEEINNGQIKDFSKKTHIRIKDIIFMRHDTTVGMIISNLIASFVVLTTAGTLFKSGINNIENPAQIAQALIPFAGNFAYLLFTIGIVGIGFQTIPILAGGVGYAISETFGFKEGLDKKFFKAKQFYLVIAASTFIGALINIIGINPIQALYYSAIINGVISAPLILVIIKLANDSRVVGNFKTTKKSNIIAWITFIFVSIASIFMLLQFIR